MILKRRLNTNNTLKIKENREKRVSLRPYPKFKDFNRKLKISLILKKNQ